MDERLKRMQRLMVAMLVVNLLFFAAFVGTLAGALVMAPRNRERTRHNAR